MSQRSNSKIGLLCKGNGTIDELLKIALEEANSDFLVYDILNSSKNYVQYKSKNSDIFSWNNLVVAKLCDLDFENINEKENILNQLKWCAHLSINYVLIDDIGLSNYLDFVKVVNNSLYSAKDFKGEIWLKFSMSVENYHFWQKIKSLSPYKSRFFSTLSLDSDTNLSCFDIWFTENPRCIFINTSLFQSDEDGKPCFPPQITKFLLNAMMKDVSIVLDSGDVNNPIELRDYIDLIKQLNYKHCLLSQSEALTAPYRDYLQIPLQPLTNNLSSGTYEIFEKDSVKYIKYSEAITKAFETKLDSINVNNVLVIGPGRGPLINICLRASKSTKKQIKLFAVEKNPFVFLTLENEKKENKLWENVTLLCKDIRDWSPPDKFDLVTSELLGSFGDNELSPEILFSSRNLLKPSGLCIPQEYSSWVSPVCSPVFHNRIARLLPENPENAFVSDKLKKISFPLENIFVVNLFHFLPLSSPKKCWSFSHEDSSLEIVDSIEFSKKEAVLEFVNETNTDIEVHGFAGYFEATLFEDVKISTNPSTHTDSMDSWFPAFFPLTDPMKLSESERLKFVIWRNATAQKIWYEWCVVEPSMSMIHNIGGRAFCFKY